MIFNLQILNFIKKVIYVYIYLCKYLRLPLPRIQIFFLTNLFNNILEIISDNKFI